MLIVAVLTLLAGAALLAIGLRSLRRHGLLSGTFWQTFGSFAWYRIKRLYGVAIAAAGILLIGWGGVLLYRSILAYYAARLGRLGP
ncbi:MAG TPA: hypothetical protein VET65_09595 [Candidatus Limnocylindrales bacterium]|nr:hypothetical protein [Candidatus Limnocylindrales bacterium]